MPEDNGTENPIIEAETFQRRIGPFAIWQWGVIVGGAAALYFFLKRRTGGTPAATPQPVGFESDFSYQSFGVLNRILEALTGGETGSAGGNQSNDASPPPSGSCQGDSDCGPGQMCNAGNCVPIPVATTSPAPVVGEPVFMYALCVSDRDCGPGQYCESGGCFQPGSSGVAIGGTPALFAAGFASSWLANNFPVLGRKTGDYIRVR